MRLHSSRRTRRSTPPTSTCSAATSQDGSTRAATPPSTSPVIAFQPLQDPIGGPNYFTMDPEALYEIHIDKDADAKEDITFQFRFQNTLANGGNGIALDIGGDAGTRAWAFRSPTSAT
ncbi:MAG: DUF4331 family protein [Polyangiaceae bacterium]